MKGYFKGLALLTVCMLLLAFMTKWTDMAFFAPVPAWLLPAAVVYFAVAYGVQYWYTVISVNKHPKAFVQSFLAVTVAVLFLHILVLVGGVYVNISGGKRFAVGFLILYVVYTIYLTASFVRFMKNPTGKTE